MRRGVWLVLVVMASGVVGCASTEEKPEKPVYLEAEKEKEPEPKPDVVAVPVAQPSPGQMRPAPPAEKPTKEEIEKAKKEGREPHDVIDAANEKAAEKPTKEGYFNALQKYDYAPGVLYQVYTAPMKVTAVSFGRNEEVQSVALGDTTRWNVGRTEAGEREIVLVKPVRAWLDTTMTVATDQRIYHLELHSYEETYMAAVRWSYPRSMVKEYQRRKKKADEEEKKRDKEPFRVGAKPTGLDFDYQFIVKGSEPRWMPRRVFDDGEKTYIQFPNGLQKKQAPALFVLSQTGETKVVNYRVRGDYYVVDGTFELAQLRLGEEDPVTVGIERRED